MKRLIPVLFAMLLPTLAWGQWQPNSGGSTGGGGGAPSGPAGGSLTGTYPNPGLAAPYGATTYTAHGFIVGEGASNLAATAACAIGSFPFGQGSSADPVCSTLILPNAATQGDLLTATGANTIGSTADVAVGQVLTSGGVGAVPVYSASPTISGANITSLNASNISSGNLGTARLPLVQIIGTPTSATATGASVTITTVSGITAGDCLFICANIDTKPTSTISAPSGFTLLETGGQLSDGTSQPQSAIMSRVVTGGEAANYAPTWTGSSRAAGIMIDVRGLAQCTSDDAVYALGNTSSIQQVAAAPASPVGFNEVNLFCAHSATSTLSMVPQPITAFVTLPTSGAPTALGVAVGSLSGEVAGGTTELFSGAGVLMH